jgi:hypothetical protein
MQYEFTSPLVGEVARRAGEGYLGSYVLIPNCG